MHFGTLHFWYTGCECDLLLVCACLLSFLSVHRLY